MKCLYYKEFNNRKILVAAPLPKPYGGIAVHAQRLKYELELMGNKVNYYQAQRYSNSFYKCFALARLVLNQKPEILISHTSYHGILESILFIFLRLVWFKHWVLVDHDCRYLDNRTRLFKWVHAIACRLADRVVMMGKTVEDLYTKHALFPKNKIVDSPYISPSRHELISEERSPAIDRFLMQHIPVLLINGSCFMKDFLGRDLYGFDVAIDLLEELKSNYPHTGLIIMLANNNDQSYFDILSEKIVLLGLKSRVLWLIGEYYLPSIVSRVTLMIRPTISENFGISIAEAIDLGIPVVASDCCQRYPGTIIYSSIESKELAQSVRSVLGEKCSLNQHFR